MAADTPLTNEQITNQFQLLSSDFIRRLSNFTKTFEGERETWKSCGYPIEVTQEAMELRYKRMGLCRTIVDVYPDDCWSKRPSVYETAAEEVTEWEKAWNALVDDDDLGVLQALKDIDRLAGRGPFAILLIGFNDGKELSQPVVQTPGQKVNFLRAYHPGRLSIHTKETDPSNKRYGKPVLYKITKDKNENTNETLVHWSRVVHLADEVDDVPWIGQHRLESVWNHILDIEKIAGGGSEMFWKGGFPGMGLMLDKEMNPDTDELSEMDSRIRDYFHGLTRALRLRGVTAQQFDVTVANPTEHFKMNIQMISSAKRIPARILLGAEQGELASTQDKEAWVGRVDERRTTFCEPLILRPFIITLTSAGVLPEIDKYYVEWPTIRTKSDKEDADIARVLTDAISRYATSPGVELVMTPYHFLTIVLKRTDEEAKAILKKVTDEFGAEEALLKKAGFLPSQAGSGTGGLGVGPKSLPQASATPKPAP